jgi:hypothetical protein
LAQQITEEVFVRGFSHSLCLYIDPQLLALFVEMTPLEAERLRRIRYVTSAPLQLGQQGRPLKLRHALRQRTSPHASIHIPFHPA